MLFCPKCGSILRPKDKNDPKSDTKITLYCSCGFTRNIESETAQIKESGSDTKKVEVVENIETNPKVKISCEKCRNTAAYYWTQQTRGADEPETRFFKCTKCSYTWREYS